MTLLRMSQLTMLGIESPNFNTCNNEFVLHNDTNLLHLIYFLFIYLFFLRELPAMKNFPMLGQNSPIKVRNYIILSG
jgi:hypothetical protein